MKKFILVLLPIMSLLLMAFRPLFQVETPQEWIAALVSFYFSLAGFAAIITFAINIMKRFGWVSDGQAAQWSRWLNLAGLVIVDILQVFVSGAITPVDTILGLLAQLGGVLFPILALLFHWPVATAISGFVHNQLRGFNFLALGYSHSFTQE